MIDKGQWQEFGQDTGVTPLLFTRSAMGFLMTTEIQDLGLMSHLKTDSQFGLSFWQHPFTAEDPLVNKWCNAKFLHIWWTHYKPEGEYIFSSFSFLGELSL